MIKTLEKTPSDSPKEHKARCCAIDKELATFLKQTWTNNLARFKAAAIQKDQNGNVDLGDADPVDKQDPVPNPEAARQAEELRANADALKQRERLEAERLANVQNSGPNRSETLPTPSPTHQEQRNVPTGPDNTLPLLAVALVAIAGVLWASWSSIAGFVWGRNKSWFG